LSQWGRNPARQKQEHFAPGELPEPAVGRLGSAASHAKPAGNNTLTWENSAMTGLIVTDGRRLHPVRSPARADVLSV
jgi:hypothetical protein